MLCLQLAPAFVYYFTWECYFNALSINQFPSSRAIANSTNFHIKQGLLSYGYIWNIYEYLYIYIEASGSYQHTCYLAHTVLNWLSTLRCRQAFIYICIYLKLMDMAGWISMSYWTFMYIYWTVSVDELSLAEISSGNCCSRRRVCTSL